MTIYQYWAKIIQVRFLEARVAFLKSSRPTCLDLPVEELQKSGVPLEEGRFFIVTEVWNDESSTVQLNYFPVFGSNSLFYLGYFPRQPSLTEEIEMEAEKWEKKIAERKPHDYREQIEIIRGQFKILQEILNEENLDLCRRIVQTTLKDIEEVQRIGRKETK